MKLIKLSEKMLKYMVLEFKSNDKEYFSFNEFKLLYPDLSDDLISKSLYLLQEDELVSVFSADDVAFITHLDVKGIRNIEEKTLLKKGYTVIKEIKSLLF